MRNVKPPLCPKCKTGRDSYLLDPKSPVCPYLLCHMGISCARFVPLAININKTNSDLEVNANGI